MKPKSHTWYIFYEELLGHTFNEMLIYMVGKVNDKWEYYTIFLGTYRVRTDYDNEEFFMDRDEYEVSRKSRDPHYYYMKEISPEEALKKLNFFPQLKTNLLKNIFNEQELQRLK